MIERWVAIWSGDESPTSLALLRILVGAVIAADFAIAGALGLGGTLWAPLGAGGFRDLADGVVPEVYRVLPHTAATSWALWATTLVTAVLFSAGAFTRLSGSVLLLTYAQTALVLPNGDRGVDNLLRNVLLVLLFSGCGRALSLDSWRRGRADAVPRWPRRLVILQVAAIYFMSGVHKIGAPWLPIGDFSALWYILHDAEMTTLSRPLPAWAWPLTQVGTASAIVFEWTFPLLLVLHRRWGGPRDPRWLWLGFGALFHLGLVATLRLGIFPWAMMALYVAFLRPDEIERGPLRRWVAGRPG
jgi:hypothetical protein